MLILLSNILIFTGSLFIFIAALGVIRMPDLYMRMHTATKAGTLGAGLLLSGTAIYFLNWYVFIEIILTVFFLILTAPVVSHLIGRVAWRKGIKIYPTTKIES